MLTYPTPRVGEFPEGLASQLLPGAEGRLTLYQASVSCLFSLCRSKLFPTSFWQRMYLQRRSQR